MRKKTKYNKQQRLVRFDFAKKYVDKEIDMFMDGVVFTTPPTDPIARENYCKSDMSKTWRKPSEHSLPELAGFDRYI